MNSESFNEMMEEVRHSQIQVNAMLVLAKRYISEANHDKAAQCLEVVNDLTIEINRVLRLALIGD